MITEESSPSSRGERKICKSSSLERSDEAVDRHIGWNLSSLDDLDICLSALNGDELRDESIKFTSTSRSIGLRLIRKIVSSSHWETSSRSESEFDVDRSESGEGLEIDSSMWGMLAQNDDWDSKRTNSSWSMVGHQLCVVLLLRGSGGAEQKNNEQRSATEQKENDSLPSLSLSLVIFITIDLIQMISFDAHVSHSSLLLSSHCCGVIESVRQMLSERSTPSVWTNSTIRRHLEFVFRIATSTSDE